MLLFGLKLLEIDAARPPSPRAVRNRFVFGWTFIQLVAAVVAGGGKRMAAGKLLMGFDEGGDLVALDGNG